MLTSPAMSETRIPPTTPGTDFIRQQIRADLETGRYDGRVVTRFPPGAERIAPRRARHRDLPELRDRRADFDGRCHLRFDDTNPEKEDEAFARAMLEDDIAVARLRLG